MAGFNDFLKRWASGGSVAEPSEGQKAQGFGFLGQTPPSVELFNSMFQSRDDQINWLYGQLDQVLRAGGVTPAESPNTQLLSALRTQFGGGGTNAGWQRLPGKLLLEWGAFLVVCSTSNGNGIWEGSTSVTWPLAFPGSVVNVQLTPQDVGFDQGLGGASAQETAFTLSYGQAGFVGAASCRLQNASIIVHYLALGGG